MTTTQEIIDEEALQEVLDEERAELEREIMNEEQEIIDEEAEDELDTEDIIEYYQERQAILELEAGHDHLVAIATAVELTAIRYGLTISKVEELVGVA